MQTTWPAESVIPSLNRFKRICRILYKLNLSRNNYLSFPDPIRRELLKPSTDSGSLV